MYFARTGSLHGGLNGSYRQTCIESLSERFSSHFERYSLFFIAIAQFDHGNVYLLHYNNKYAQYFMFMVPCIIIYSMK